MTQPPIGPVGAPRPRPLPGPPPRPPRPAGPRLTAGQAESRTQPTPTKAGPVAPVQQTRTAPPQQSSQQPNFQRPVAPTPTPTQATKQPNKPDAPTPISPQPQRDVEPRRPGFVSFGLPVSTTDLLPGREVASTIGIVLGISTRPRDMAHNPEMAYYNASARQDAIGAMVAQAREAGADAVIGVRFDSGKISETVTELAAYGTAVTLR